MRRDRIKCFDRIARNAQIEREDLRRTLSCARICAVSYCVRGYALRLAERANDGNIRQSKTLKDPFRHPFRPLLPKNARLRARPCGRFRERCVFGNERSLVANGCEDAPSMTPLGIAPAASPHALALFLAAAAETPLKR